MRRWRWLLIASLVSAFVAVGCGEPRIIQNRAATLVELTGPYSVEPFPVDPILAGRFDSLCRQRIAGTRAPVLALLDARGLATAMLLYVTADGFTIECRVAIDADGTVRPEHVFSTRFAAVQAPVLVQPVTADIRNPAMGGIGMFFESGVVAAPVVDVVIVLNNGRQVRASVGSGLYTASWPDDSLTTERQAYDANGALIPGGP